MPNTPDRFPGTREEEEIQLYDDTTDPSVSGSIKQVNGKLIGRDSTGTFDLRNDPHATTHEDGGTDELTIQNLGSGAVASGYLLESDGTGGWDLVDVVFGFPPELDYAISATEETTTLDTWQQKLRLTTSDLTYGRYILFAQATLSGTLSSTKIGIQAQLDDSETFGSISANPGVADGELMFFTHTVKVDFSGVHNIDIDYRMISGGGSAKIKDARITIWKVGT